MLWFAIGCGAATLVALILISHYTYKSISEVSAILRDEEDEDLDVFSDWEE